MEYQQMMGSCLPLLRRQRLNSESPLEAYAAIATADSSAIPVPGGVPGGSAKSISMNSGCGTPLNHGGCSRETKTKILAVVRGERSGDTRDGCFYSPPKSGYPGSQPTADLEKLAPPISESTPELAIPIRLRCSDRFGVPRLRWRDFQICPLH